VLELRRHTYLELLLEVEKNGLLADSHNIVNCWKEYFSQLSNPYVFNEV
jgi:hypothetical protein